MTTHSDKRRDKARAMAKAEGISVRTAYRNIARKENLEESEAFDYEKECPKGKFV